ncbi:hypothetical protein O3P69_018179 [Scylla paramamosain]|uniref:Uncharacterized protein n=1 Tax=Scylla paramamosain TaxID=85552 RepID=A0AAW0TJW9_SCYPA
MSGCGADTTSYTTIWDFRHLFRDLGVPVLTNGGPQVATFLELNVAETRQPEDSRECSARSGDSPECSSHPDDSPECFTRLDDSPEGSTHHEDFVQ